MAAYESYVTSLGPPIRNYRLSETTGTTGASSIVNSGSDGTSKNGTPIVAVTSVAGPLQDGDTTTAQVFNGTTQAISAGAIATASAASLTLNCWVKFGATSQFAMLFGNALPSSGGGAGFWQQNAAFNGAGTHVYLYTSSTLSAGWAVPDTTNWHMLTAVFNASGYSFYADGALVTSGAFSYLAATGQSIIIGNASAAVIAAVTATQFFNGDLGNCEIYNGVALTALQVQNLFDYGNGTLTPTPPSAPTITINTTAGNDTVYATAPTAGGFPVGGQVLFQSINGASYSAIQTVATTGTVVYSGVATARAGGRDQFYSEAYDTESPANFGSASNIVFSATASVANSGGVTNVVLPPIVYGSAYSGDASQITVQVTQPSNGAVLYGTYNGSSIAGAGATTVTEQASGSGIYGVTVPIYNSWGNVIITVTGPAGTTPQSFSTSAATASGGGMTLTPFDLTPTVSSTASNTSDIGAPLTNNSGTMRLTVLGVSNGTMSWTMHCRGKAGDIGIVAASSVSSRTTDGQTFPNGMPPSGSANYQLQGLPTGYAYYFTITTSNASSAACELFGVT